MTFGDHPGSIYSLPQPGSSQGAAVSATTAASSSAIQTPADLSATIASLPLAYTADKLPPTLPTSFKRWVPQTGDEIPRDKNAYFPMTLIR